MNFLVRTALALITLLLADSHSQYRQGLRQVCEVDGRFRVVAEAESFEQLIRLARHHRPQVLLVDIELPGLAELETIRQERSLNPEQAIILLSLYGAERLADSARQAGAWTALAKDCDETALFAAIQDAHRSVAHPAPTNPRDSQHRRPDAKGGAA